jgi:two-component system, cell cycle response regulator DivK
VTRRRVLIADDNEHNREYARQVLEDGWSILLAQDGHDTLDKLARERPDLALVDLSMPGVNGWEVARRAKADRELAAIPLVACTAHAMSGDRERALATGFDGYLAKPYRPAELVACVESFLGPAERRDENDGEWEVGALADEGGAP